MSRAERIEAELVKVEAWVAAALKQAESCAKDRRFLSLAKAYDADVRNYGAMLKRIRSALAPSVLGEG
ncbi:MAG: hypothetical protein IPO00_08795 [Betaproteobacteria bacterium]|nr:hypothetical protein [Betaproteobacteria bacterium]